MSQGNIFVTVDVAGDFTVNIGLINYTFCLATIWWATSIFIAAVAVISFLLGLWFRTSTLYIQV